MGLYVIGVLQLVTMALCWAVYLMLRKPAVLPSGVAPASEAPVEKAPVTYQPITLRLCDWQMRERHEITVHTDVPPAIYTYAGVTYLKHQTTRGGVVIYKAKP